MSVILFFGGIIIAVIGKLSESTGAIDFGKYLAMMGPIFFFIGLIWIFGAGSAGMARAFKKDLENIKNKDINPELQKQGALQRRVFTCPFKI